MDIETQETTLSEIRFEKPELPLEVDSRFQNREWEKMSWKRKEIRWEKRRARLVLEETREKKSVEMETRVHAVKKPETVRSFWTRLADFEALDQRRKLDLAPLVRNARVTDGYLGKTAYQSMVGKLSMRDINRYQFQKNHPAKPGLRGVPAGGGNPPQIKP